MHARKREREKEKERHLYNPSRFHEIGPLNGGLSLSMDV